MKNGEKKIKACKQMFHCAKDNSVTPWPTVSCFSMRHSQFTNPMSKINFVGFKAYGHSKSVSDCEHFV